MNKVSSKMLFLVPASSQIKTTLSKLCSTCFNKASQPPKLTRLAKSLYSTRRVRETLMSSIYCSSMEQTQTTLTPTDKHQLFTAFAKGTSSAQIYLSKLELMLTSSTTTDKLLCTTQSSLDDTKWLSTSFQKVPMSNMSTRKD